MNQTKIRGAVVIVMMFITSGTVFGATVLDDFGDFMSPPLFVQDVEMLEGDNLMIVNPDTGVPEVVSGKWYVGFLKSVEGGYSVAGAADNPYSTGHPGYEGWLQGFYERNLLGIGNRPDEIWIVNDGLDDGIGVFDSGTWIRNPDDILYTTQDILFGQSQVRGDLSQLPVCTGAGLLTLPSMTIDPIPEPATILVVLLGAGAFISYRRHARHRRGA